MELRLTNVNLKVAESNGNKFRFGSIQNEPKCLNMVKKLKTV